MQMFWGVGSEQGQLQMRRCLEERAMHAAWGDQGGLTMDRYR